MAFGAYIGNLDAFPVVPASPYRPCLCTFGVLLATQDSMLGQGFELQEVSSVS